MKRKIVSLILCMVLLLAVTTVNANPYRDKEVFTQEYSADETPIGQYVDPLMAMWGLDQVTWTQVGSAITPFIRAASGHIGDYVYCFGEQSSNVGQAYNINTQQWVSATPPLLGNCNWCGVGTDDAIYIIGRYDGGYGNEVQKFTPTGGGPTGTWQLMAPYPLSLCAITADWDGDNYIYAAGGDATNPAAYRYDITANTWSPIASMPGPMRYAGGAFVNGKFYVMGGTQTGMASTNYEYDPVSDTWATRAPIPTEVHFGLFSFTYNQTYVLSIGGGGGYGTWPATNAVQLYDPTTNTWSQETPLSQALGCNTGVWIGGAGDVVSAGGYDGVNYHTETYFGQNFPGGAPPDAPAAPTNFTVEDNGATIMASLSWTNPTTTVSGGTLTSIDSVFVERDGVIVNTYATATPGQAMAWDDNTMSQAGSYSYSVWCSNTTGHGVHANASAWIGPDVPHDVNDLVMTPGANYQMEATLTWVNPTSGAHGGFYPGITGYTIFRDSDEGHTATFDLPGTQTSFLDETVPDPDYYWYDVTPYNASGDGLTATSNTGWVGIPEIWTWEEVTYGWDDISGVGVPLTIGDDQNLGPFNLEFTFTFYGLEFTSIRICSNGFLSFTSTSSSLSNTAIPNSAEPNNLIAMFWDDLNPSQGGQVYYYANTANGTFTVQFQDVPHYSSGGTNTFQCIFDEDDGTIRINYQTISPPLDEATVGIEDDSGTEGIELNYNGVGPYQITNNTSIVFNPPVTGVGGQPGVVTDLVGIVGEMGALSCSLSWANPTIDALGQPLADTSLVGVKVVRDAVVIADLTPATVGAPMSFMDSPIPAAGLYEYTVYGYNDTYDGLTNTLDPLWVGEDVPGEVTTLWMEPDAGMALRATLTWVNPLAGAHGGYFTTIQGYHIERSDGVILELIGENTMYVDNTVPGSDYYYYTVTPYNASGDGTSATSNTAYVGPPQIYTWETLPFVWNDISTIGTNSGLNSDDQNVGPFDLGFAVEFYEEFFSTIRLCSNGWHSYTSTVATPWTNPSIPTAAEPNNLIAPFYDDLTLSSSGTVYYYSDAVNHTFTIQFDNVPHLGTGGPYTFQTVIKQDGTIELYYHTIGTLNNSCTVGVENGDGTEGLQVCYNGAGDFIPQDGTAIRINPPYTGFGQVSGTVTLDGAVGDIQDVMIADGYGAVTYCGPTGDYLLDSARAGDRYITASLDSFFYDSTQMVFVPVDSIVENVDFTLRRLEPTIPTGLAAVVDTTTGAVTLTWDAHPDPTVDIYLLQRKFATEQWMALTIVPAAMQTFVDNLPEEGQWFYRIACSDLNVVAPPSQSDYSEEIEVIWGELPPSNLVTNGNYDDRIRLNWDEPGGGGPGPVSILVVDDDGSVNNGGTYTAIENTFYTALDDAGYTYDTFIVDWSITVPPQDGPTASEMADYDVVIWFAGETWGYYGADVLTANDETNLASYLDGGGNFFLSAQDYFYACYPSASSFTSGQFPYDYLGVSATTQDYWSSDVTWTGGTGSLAAGMTFNTLNPFSGSSMYADALTTSGTDLLLNTALSGANQYDAGSFKIVFTTVSFAGLVDGTAPSTKAQFMSNAIDFLAGARSDQLVSAPPRPSIPPVDSYNPASRSVSLVSVEKHSASKGAPHRNTKTMPTVDFRFPTDPVSQIIRDTQNQVGRTMTADRSRVSDELDQVLEYYKIYRDGSYLDTCYATEYFDTGIPEDVLYEYYVTAMYDNGQESGASNSDTARCNMAPGVPVNFTGIANATEDSMILTWDDPTVNMDGTPCVDLDELTIYRNGVFIVDVQPSVETYTDGVPNPTMTYTWTIAAKDEVPNEGDPAEFSGEVQSPWNQIPYFWNDISGIGTNTGITGDDQNAGPFNLGFDFVFYGNTFSSIRVCSNGWLSFTSTVSTYTNAQIPTAAEPNNLVAPFWDDLYPPSGGTIYYYQDQAAGWFIVQYDAVPHIGSGGPYTFQVILTDEGAFYYNYHTINDPNNSCTVGVENATGTDGISICYNGAGDFIPVSGTSISIWGGPPPEGDLEGYVRESEDNDPIEDAMVVCGTDTGYTDATGFYEIIGILTGHYTATASMFGYNSESDTVTIVEDQTHIRNFFLPQPIIDVDVTSIVVSMAPGAQQDETFNISNLGDGLLEFDIDLIETDATIEIAPSQGSRSMPVQVASRSRFSKTSSVETKTASVGPVRFNSFGLDETDEPWATVSPLQGTVDPGDAQLITVAFEVPSTSVPGDIWEADLIINNNTITPDITIPLEVTVVPAVLEEELLPLEYALYQNYPNPFNPMTRIRFDLRERSHVVLEVYNVMGQKVATVVNRTMNAGRYSAEFDGTQLASGLYFYRISANNFQDLKKMVLVK